jgi:hypothetical protein
MPAGGVIRLTDGCRSGPQNGFLCDLREHRIPMNMSQLVIGSALGFFVAQGALFSVERLIGWLQRDEARRRIRDVPASQGYDLIGAFIRHAGLLGASAALITLGVWTAKDYLAGKSARSTAIASTFDSSTPVSESADPPGAALQPAAPAAASAADPSAVTPVHEVDPYADPDFQVHRRPHRAVSLKEKLVLQSEAKARAELLTETQQHLHRSQYDCEAAGRAGKYVKAGLDVWGFASWQVKYFPVKGYEGATIPQCEDIKNVIDPSWVNLQTTVAQTNQPGR